MLACTAMLVGCSDDVIGEDNLNGQAGKVPAYLSVSFSTGGSSSRSTADDANNKGDKDGNAEHSGHINIGSEAENNINSALLVVKSTNNESGYARLYTFSDALKSSRHNDEDHYTLAEDIELAAATYDVLVVANPYESLYQDANNTKYADLDVGTTTTATIEALYKAILDGQSPSIDESEIGHSGNNFAGSILTTDNDTDTPQLKSIMMANKSQCQVELKPNVDNYACVEIERVASKITYRPVRENNLYEVKVPNLTSVVIDSETSEDGNTIYNKAMINGENGEELVYIVLTQDKTFEGLYRKNENAFTKDEDVTSFPNSYRWVYKTADGTAELTWYVKLEEYALVNLSKHVYNVRHTIAEAPAVPFGTLTRYNFLYTPNWETTIDGWTINDVKFKDGEFDKQGFTTGAWFYNTLANVSKDSKKSTDKTYFATLPGSYTATSPDDDVDNVSGGLGHYTKEDNTPAIGELLAYCLENSTDITHQTHGLSTGITFMGKIYGSDKTTPISTLYRYNGYLFQSIAAIKTAYNITEDSDWANIGETSTADELAKVGVVKYDGNTCYYYTTEIKHYDNGIYPGEKDDQGNLKEPLGNMEFAIMRNNIYSLSVSNISIIGDPWVDPIPSTPDEIAKPKLEVHAEIMPWIVRYHDIEF